MAKPRVHEVAFDLGVDSRAVLKALRELGEFVKSPSSTLEPPVARKVRAYLENEGKVAAPFTMLGTESSLEVGELLVSLPGSLPAVARALAGDATDHEVAMQRVLDEGMLFFVLAERGKQVGLRRNHDQLALHDIPATTGLVAIERSRRVELLMWAVGERGLWASDLSLIRNPRNATTWATVPESGSAGLRSDGTFSTELRPLGLLQQVIELAPRVAAVRTQMPSGQRSFGGLEETTVSSRFWRPAAEPGGSPRSAGSQAMSRDDGVRWKVRGHWRRQWYPSTGEHQPIWIKEHTAGAIEGHMVDRDHVYVI